LEKNQRLIVITYGLFLGWLLSFPYNGPALKQLIDAHGVSGSAYSLTYTLVPAIFLIIFVFFSVKEQFAKPMMTWSIGVCLVGTALLFTVSPRFWYPVFVMIGICSVLAIIGWSYFYTKQVPIAQKMPVMALVMIIGNLIYYVINIGYHKIPANLLLVVLLSLLAGSLWAGAHLNVQAKNSIPVEEQPLPVKLMIVLCFFLFVINLTGGLTLHAINPSFDQRFLSVSTYYGILPYVLTLLFLFAYKKNVLSLFPVFLGTSLLGFAYLSFGLMGGGLLNYFITETFLQVGWALLDLILWTLFGVIASVYGRPLQICGLAFIANLTAVFAGGVLGIYLKETFKNYYLMAGAFAIAIIFISVLLAHWLNQAIERDLHTVMKQKEIRENRAMPEEEQNNMRESLLDDNLPSFQQLTPREKEITSLLLQGYTNMQIAAALEISENTLKTHNRNIYAKLKVANKRELLQRVHGGKYS
jgi:DNA-binding NarL/FixJ family response regulator